MDIIIKVLVICFTLFCLYKFLGVVFGKSSSSVSNDSDEIVFKSSRVSGGALVVPQKLIFTQKSIKLITNLGGDSLWTAKKTQSIPYKKIVGIEVDRFINGCDITIIGNGVQNIYAVGFNGRNTNKIEKMVNCIIEEN